MVEYLTPDHPDAFVDSFKQQPQPEIGFTHKCPKCKGHGGWNLKLNAYGLPPGYKNDITNRHKYSHFRAHCDQCNGWGYTAEPSTCIHQFDRELERVECKERGLYHAGRCWHVYECGKCGKIISQDSSD
jgi:hypothetical protein